eukprot:gnl/Spiro4/10222_TR5434_c0_g1_i1.p1 gnl/Spiro4/10222_TR5434_c0_g1~~gnl/Spiro4/10222_TR5434_c0_g1_i1.p1  ORF type:complete len:510 (+),score=187.85 gnl/Spiro4/10222_TR5434_c0_g1_i1:64-1530(+)
MLKAKAVTKGVAKSLLAPFANDPRLAAALEAAKVARRKLGTEFRGKGLTSLGEMECVSALQEGIVNFYSPNGINRFVAVAAQGPWIVTLHGAVLYDVGGYGMLGLGHNHPALSEVLGRDQAMANIMTPSFSQRRFIDIIRREIGHSRTSASATTACPYEGFMCLNSGSESVGLACRLADIHSHSMTRANAKHAGKHAALLSITGSFHGRVTRAAHLSESCHDAYRTHLASFQPHRHPKVLHASMNDLGSLNAAFEQASRENLHIELCAIEPVMGEGKPGVTVTRNFYDAARQLTLDADSLLLVDSIQAGLRASGTLSLVDYPGFETAVPPDFETFSKALNAGQFPLSVLALGPRSVGLYKHGVYGNTMTGNPRGLDIASEVLRQITPKLRDNIRVQGASLLAGLRDLQRKYPHVITHCEGSGLLLAANINEAYPVVAENGLEQQCRANGLEIIHCGDNALRFTPHFEITPLEVQLCLQIVENVIVANA